MHNHSGELQMKPVVWAIIPARGGSKAIPLKNLFIFGGRPLLWYTATALLHSGVVDRIICSTDDDLIAGYCTELEIEVHNRPAELSGDAISVVDVVQHLLKDLNAKEKCQPDIVVLGQPTSPFIMPEHVDQCVKKLMADNSAASSQTVVEIPHHNHYINQRRIAGGYVSFIHEKERFEKFNKQKKEKTYALGNLIATRTAQLFSQNQLFANPSIPIIIHPIFGFDLDTYQDAEVGECFFHHPLLSDPIIRGK
ncbi:MAG: acylneuraminate cytidylyltransferase [uncultured bacterium]|nr:MAG: acylneuraminate cytidylyltransferase [uncultured bacterium]